MSKVNLDDVILVAMLTPMGNPRDTDINWGLPLFLWGDPGIGKSSRVRSVGNRMGMKAHVLHTPTLVPDDFGPLTVPDGDGGLKSISQLPAANELFEKGNGILFIDELSSGRPAVQAACLGVVLDRMIAGKKLPRDTRIIAAGNPMSSASSGWELDPPTANRFCHINVYTPIASDWVEWLLGTNATKTSKSVENLLGELYENWENSWKYSSKIVADFITKNPGLLFVLPKEGEDNRGLGWPSPRTWEFVTHVLTTVSSISIPNKTDILNMLLEGCIGTTAGAFINYLQYLNLPNYIDVLEGKWTIPVDRLDIVNQVLFYVCNVVLELNKDSHSQATLRTIQYWKLLETCSDMGFVDIVTVYAQKLTKESLSLRSKVIGIRDISRKVLGRLAETGVTHVSG